MRDLILEASKRIIERDGLMGLSAREIARNIGYSPGTLYNIFDSLDELLLTLQTQLLSDVLERLKTVERGSDPHDYVDRLARTYTDAANAQPGVWSLLFSHQIQDTTPIPPAALQHTADVAHIIGDALKPFMNGASDDERDNAARALWCGIHGITAVAVTQKGPKIKSETVHSYVQLLTSTFTKGLTV